MFRVFVFFQIAIMSLLHAGHGNAGTTNESFQFETIRTLDEMSSFIRQHFSLGSSRRDLRQVFVTEGQATLRIHPHNVGVEKYIYDVNLCNYYVWRWNISADYDADGKLQQAYMNGNIIFADGKPKKMVSQVAEKKKKASIYKAQRPRPEAYKGESTLGFLLLDRDGNTKTIHDQVVIGSGPSRVDPVDMGKMVVYTEVERWRSIFDKDQADHIALYQGDCTAVDSFMQNR